MHRELRQLRTRLATSAKPCHPQNCFVPLTPWRRVAIGHRMFTALLYHPDTQETERIYTNQMDKYPLRGRKPPRRDRWSKSVIDCGEIFFISSTQDVKDNFADAVTLLGLGIGSGMCLPIRLRDHTLGTINVLAAADVVSERHSSIGRIIAALAVPAFEAEQRALGVSDNKA